MTGTFARVWLARLKRQDKKDQDKLYALKVLRKADGKLCKTLAMNGLLIHGAVIRLKQVDHVNHERAILKDVAGHPFITTLITTFSDQDSLYMLVSSTRELYTFLFGSHLANGRIMLTLCLNSLITALVGKYSPT
jgi:serine/threonine protein kinase